VVLNAKHWTPQSRARLFIIARRDDGEERETLALESDARPEKLSRFVFANQHIQWNIRALPPLPKPTTRLKQIVNKLPADDPHWWNEKRVRHFMGQLSERHQTDAQRMIESHRISYATAFRRVRNEKSMAELRTDGIAGCLRTPRGGSGRQ